MKNIQLKEEVKQMLTTGELLNQLFGYAYKHCFSREEAEELCQEIIMQILEGISKGREITNLEGYIWGVARNTYSDHVAARKKHSLHQHTMDDLQDSHDEGFENQYIHKVMEENTFKLIRRRIAFLSRIYRDVMVMFYLEEMSIKEIATVLEIPENRVKQRLFTAKHQIKEEVSEMKTNYEDNLLKPIKMTWVGDGDCSKSGYKKLERLMAQNIMYACRKEGQTVKELAEEFQIPTVFMEDELEYLRTWPGLLKKIDNKYIADMMVIDEEVQNSIDRQSEQVVEAFCKELTVYLRSREQQIMELNYLGAKKDFSFILWSIIIFYADMITNHLQAKVMEGLKDLNIETEKKDYYLLGVVEKDKKIDKQRFYGCNGTHAAEILGYKCITIRNFIGYRLPWEAGRFGAGENIGENRELMMMLRTIGGLEIESLTEKEEEIVAKAIQKGYVKKENHMIVPNVIVMEIETALQLGQHLEDANEMTERYAEVLVEHYQQLIKKHLPKHLLGQASKFVSLTSSTLRSYLVEACIENGLLHIPNTEQCGEGIIVNLGMKN